MGLRAAMERDPKVVLMGEDIGKLGGRLPRHGRTAEGLRRGPRHRHPHSGSRASSAPRSAWPCAATARCARSSSTASSSRPSIRSCASWRRCPNARRVIRGCPSWCGSRSVAASVPSSTTRNRPRRTSRTPPGSASWPAPTPSMPTWMIQQAIASDDPVIFFEPKRALLGKVRARRIGRPACGGVGPGPRRA